MSSTTIKNKTAKNNTSFIILAAAPGKRMKTYGLRSLLSLGMETVIEQQILYLMRSYINPDIVVVSGFEHKKLREKLRHKYPARLIYNPKYKECSPVYSVALGLDACLNKNICLIYGDIVFNKETISGLPETSGMLLDTNNNIERNKIGIVHQNGQVLNLSYAAAQKWGQILYISHEDLAVFEKIFFYSENQKLVIYECLNKLVDKIKLHTITPRKAKFIELNNIDDLSRAKLIKD